jgi:hypothetical protein
MSEIRGMAIRGAKGGLQLLRASIDIRRQFTVNVARIHWVVDIIDKNQPRYAVESPIYIDIKYAHCHILCQCIESAQEKPRHTSPSVFNQHRTRKNPPPREEAGFQHHIIDSIAGAGLEPATPAL